MVFLSTNTLLILMYIILALFFTLWATEVLKAEVGRIDSPYPRLTAILFGVFFPVFLVIGFFTVLNTYLNKKES
jgi:peptidoglycan biosynthesis protein MviN/MurJ (putative lipid II flippase)